MGANTKISWCDDSVSLWWGCQEVSPECDHCYAKGLAKRVGKGRAWQDIRYEVPSAFKTLDKLQRKAAKTGLRTVFVQSMADIFERNQQLVTWQGRFTGRGTAEVRDRFFDGITLRRWPNLIFLLLTKRPGLISDQVPYVWLSEEFGWPENVWTGTSCGVTASEPRVGRLLKAPGPHFVSIEPLLEPVDLTFSKMTGDWDIDALRGIWMREDPGDFEQPPCLEEQHGGPKVNWVIIGVESRGSRVGRLGPCGTEEAWNDMAAFIVADCNAAGVPVFVKQCPVNGRVSHDPAEWDERLRRQEFPAWRATVQGAA